jgi:hypothetical protein
MVSRKSKRTKKTRIGEARRVKAVSYLYRRGFSKKEILKFARLQERRYTALRKLTPKRIHDYWKRVNSRRARNARRNFIQEGRFQKVQYKDSKGNLRTRTKLLAAKIELMQSRLPKEVRENIFEEGS